MSMKLKKKVKELEERVETLEEKIELITHGSSSEGGRP